MADKMNTQDKLAESLREILDVTGGYVPNTSKSTWRRAQEALQAHAAEAAQAAEPVYQYQDTPDSWVDCDYDLYNASGDPKRILYTRPQPAQDAKDGARYRFLADHQDADLYMENPGKELLDRAIDAAMAKEYGR